MLGQIPRLLPQAQETTKEDIKLFWGELYEASYSEDDAALQPESLQAIMPELAALFRHRRHLAAVEMEADFLVGKTVLEIGSGAGGHSAYFRWLGANIVAMDLTVERVVATSHKLEMLRGEGEYFCLQGDAERLPFADGIFDVVYSNGVLHHTPDTAGSIREIHRVLKPGGQAAVMLYSKHSYYYWVVLFLLKGIFLGQAFRSKNWLGRVTEWMSDKPQSCLNPETKVYSASEVRRMFGMFESISIRKNSFVVQQIPLLGPVCSRLLAKFAGVNPAGRLLYGIPWRNETSWELTLGRWLGFGLNIKATK